MPLELLVHSLLGVAFAQCARERVRADGPFAAPAFLLVLSFVGVVLLPVTLYLYVAHADWTWMYMVDPADVPGLALVPILVLHGGAVVGGWYLGTTLLRAGKQQVVWGLLGGGGVTVVALVFALRDRLFTYGTHRDFHAGTALDLMDVKLGYVLIALFIGVGGSAGFVAFELYRDSRRVRAR
jgi:hypothetical protein